MRLPQPLLASAFAKTCGAALHGPDQPIRGANEIHGVEPGDLTFVDHPKYYRRALASAASVVLIDALPPGGPPPGKTLLVHPDPFAAYDALVREHRPPRALNAQLDVRTDLHPAAVIEPGAVIGPHVSIGAHSRVEANAVVYGPTRIGKGCRIGAGAVIGDQAFYFRGLPPAGAPERTRERGRRRWTTGGDVVVEDFVEIGPLCNVARGVSATTRIGRASKLDAACQIGHDVTVGAECLLAAQVGLAGNVRLGDRVTLYGQVGVAQNVTIGAGATVLAKAGVSKDIPPGATYNGIPAQPAREYLRGLATLRRLARG